MPFSKKYKNQVALLMSVMPAVAKENCFALKGGTAINLFIRDLPRLSVDIDLTYLPIADRAKSLTEIDEALKRIGVRINSA
jgi:predicted nucleotidyltransferase component of viral defense system